MNVIPLKNMKMPREPWPCHLAGWELIWCRNNAAFKTIMLHMDYITFRRLSTHLCTRTANVVEREVQEVISIRILTHETKAT